MDDLETALRNELNVPAGDDERINRVRIAAEVYVKGAVGNADIARSVYVDCVVGCAADLYNSRDARLGVLDTGSADLEPFRVPTDPLRSVWPKLNAAGIATGGMVIV